MTIRMLIAMSAVGLLLTAGCAARLRRISRR